MNSSPQPRTRTLTIVAQDPGVRQDGKILTAEVEVPAEELAAGPCGYRVHVIDYDSSSHTLYRAREDGLDGDPFKKPSNRTILSDPHFHAQNVYAIVMRTLARFEYALGRRVSWSFYGHQLKIAPHAFADANAFYSEENHALMFGYFPGSKGTVFSCLSHDVVAHETTHALVDGLRSRYTDPSSPDQAAFHEGFADVVALLSVFSLGSIVERLLAGPSSKSNRIASTRLTVAALRESILFGLADEMGRELSGVRGKALRRSADMEPSASYIRSAEFQEPHRRGEILVAAMMNAFLEVWRHRLKGLDVDTRPLLDLQRVVEDGAATAEHLLTMSIRALDYCPPTDIRFSDFLSALLTADRELVPDDSKYRYRQVLLNTFRRYGIVPTSEEPDGVWEPPDCQLNYDRTHFESMQRDPDEVFRFIWENRKGLGLYEGAYSRVESVRPCIRLGPDGFALRETVVEYTQVLKLKARELKQLKIRRPAEMPATQEVTLYGGGALILDEYGRLKFLVRNRVDNHKLQSERLDYLWRNGFLANGQPLRPSFSALHRERAINSPLNATEQW
jgi:hypothetical protein